MQLQMHVCVSKCWFYRILIFFFIHLWIFVYNKHTFTLCNTFLFEVAPLLSLYMSVLFPKHTNKLISFIAAHTQLSGVLFVNICSISAHTLLPFCKCQILFTLTKIQWMRLQWCCSHFTFRYCEKQHLLKKKRLKRKPKSQSTSMISLG